MGVPSFPPLGGVCPGVCGRVGVSDLGGCGRGIRRG